MASNIPYQLSRMVDYQRKNHYYKRAGTIVQKVLFIVVYALTENREKNDECVYAQWQCLFSLNKWLNDQMLDKSEGKERIENVCRDFRG